MGNLEDEFPTGGLVAPNRVLNRELFLFLLDHEVKRARRYQNFICLLLLRLQPSSKNDSNTDFQDLHRVVSHLLMEEIRESDIIGYFGKNQLVVLLDRHHAPGIRRCALAARRAGAAAHRRGERAGLRGLGLGHPADLPRYGLEPGEATGDPVLPTRLPGPPQVVNLGEAETG
jgi:hypothetical protein